MINTIILGHALNELPKLPAESINCVTCSPPYWGLRDYGIEPVIWDGDKDCKHEWGNKNITLKHKSGETNPGKESWFKDKGASDDKGNCFCIKCGAWRGSLGLEPNFELYMKHLCDIFDEIKRVLRKDGTCWINLGDSYGGSGNASGHTKDTKNLGYKTSEMGATKGHTLGLTPKSLCLIPQRFAIEMVNRGWILRNTIIWHKPNCMPSSAKDRFTVDFEYIYFFVKSKRYFFEQQFEEYAPDTLPRMERGVNVNKWTFGADGQTPHNLSQPRLNKKRGYKTKQMDQETHRQQHHGKDINYGKYGRNKRCVWKIPTKSFKEAHFATFPVTLIEPIIKAGCPEFVCKKCGRARVKIYEKHKMPEWDKTHKNNAIYKLGKTSALEIGGPRYNKWKEENPDKFTGYTDCGCNAGFEGGIVLDPFMGAGASALVALKQRKRFVGIEIKQEYIDMANKRIAKVQQEIF